MRIAAMAAGAVGAYFGARLQAAGHEVFYIARGAHREALEKNGLTIASVHGDLHLPKVNVADDPAKVGPVDTVLFAVKLWDTEKAAEQARPLLGPDTRVITLQNGVDSYERIAPIVGAERAIPGVTYVVTVIERPGVIKQTSQFQRIICGTHDGRADAPLAGLRRGGQGGAPRHRAVGQYRARPLAQIHFAVGDLRRHIGHPRDHGADSRRSRHARAVPQPLAGGLHGRPRQGRDAR